MEEQALFYLVCSYKYIRYQISQFQSDLALVVDWGDGISFALRWLTNLTLLNSSLCVFSRFTWLCTEFLNNSFVGCIFSFHAHTTLLSLNAV